MKAFIFGFLTAVGVTVCLAVGTFFILGNKVEERLFGPWEEKKQTELKLAFYPSVNIELSDALGLNAQELADFLSQGNEESRESYFSILNSGLDVEIVSYYESSGPNRTQRIQFKDGKVRNNIIKVAADVVITRDEIEVHWDEIPDSNSQVSDRLLEAVNKRISGLGSVESTVKYPQMEIGTEPDGRINSVPLRSSP